MKRNKAMLLSIMTVATLLGTSVPALAADLTSGKIISESSYLDAAEYVNERFEGYGLSEKQIDYLINDTIEKYQINDDSLLKSAVNNHNSISKSENEGFDEVDEAYNIFLDKMDYIVTLINSFGENTFKDNTEFNRDFVVKNYQAIKNIEDVNLVTVDWYIEEATIALETESLPDSAEVRSIVSKSNVLDNVLENDIINATAVTATATYDRTAAVDYANKYYSSYNSAYPDWNSLGGDCANFVSQCLKAGGKTYNVTESAATSTKATDWSNWYSYGSSQNTTKVSSTHRGANAFKGYWQSKVSYSTFTSVGSSSYSYGYRGDAVSLLDSSGLAYHSLIIVGYDATNKDFVLAAHTSNTNTKKLSSVSLSTKGFVIYSMG